MSIERVRAYFAQYGLAERVMETEKSSATVEEAAVAVGVEPARIAKTLSLRMGEGCLPAGVEVFLDESMRRFDTVYPACGSANSAIGLTLAELERFSRAQGWVDVCKTA